MTFPTMDEQQDFLDRVAEPPPSRNEAALEEENRRLRERLSRQGLNNTLAWVAVVMSSAAALASIVNLLR